MVRAALRTLDPVAPAAAARLATRIWLTPPKARRSRAGAAASAPAAAGVRFTVPLPGAGSPLVAEAWGEGPVTYLVHGWGGWRGQLAGLVAPLVSAGYRVVAMDAPGHGESGPGRLGGRRVTLTEVAEALFAVAAVAGAPHAVVSHSGGANATALAIREGLTADRLVFLAPMADPWPYLDPFAQALGIGERTLPRVVRRVEALVRRDAADFRVPGWARRAGPGELPPLLVIHDRGDREVRYQDGCAIAQSWPGASLHTTEGLGHRRIVRDPAVVEATVSFLAAPVMTGAGSSGRS